MKTKTMLVTLTFLAGVTLWAGEIVPTSKLFKDGDRVVFLGDSITHHGRYMEQIALYYATRFPERNIWFSESGESGGVVEGVKRRMDTDIIAKRPTVVTFMFGMNDVNRNVWPRGNDDAEKAKRRQMAIAGYTNAVENVIQRIRSRANNPSIVYITPSPYDQECVIDGQKSSIVCNDGLRILGDLVKSRAVQEGAGYVDLQTYLRELNEREQAKDPTWSFMRVGKDKFDRIHPREYGHQYFAYAFLKSQGAPAEVASIAIAKSEVKASNAEVTDFKVDGESISFTALEKALPYPFNADRKKACDYAPIVEDLNREILSVNDLKDGWYVVEIDGGEVGRWTAKELAAGVNLAMVAHTPQYVQAQKVMEENARLWQNEILIRDLLMWRLWRSGKGVPLDDMSAYREWFSKTWPKGVKGDFYGWVAEHYLNHWERKAEIEAAIERSRAEVKRLAKCVPHRWRIYPTETVRIQAEIDRVSMQGGGKVVISKGVHPSETLYLKSNVELHLEEGAVLLGGDRSACYDDAIPVREVYSYAGSHTNTTTRKAFIYAENATNIAITGKGTIDGQGQKFFDHNTVLWGCFWAKPPCMRPRMIVFMNCRGIRLENATFKDCPVWTMWLRLCEDITVAGIRIEAEPKMINSDGIDFDGCRNVRVGDSTIETGDDCLVLRAIRNGVPDGVDVITENVVVSNCVLKTPCQGVRIGCPSDDTIRNAVFRDIVFTGSNGVFCDQQPQYLDHGNRGRIRTDNLVFENWKIDCRWFPISVVAHPRVVPRDLGHMVFRNFEITSGLPITIKGNSEVKVRDITLENIRIKTKAEKPVVIENVEDVRVDVVRK